MSDNKFNKKHVNDNALKLWRSLNTESAIYYFANEYNISQQEAAEWCHKHLKYSEILTVCTKCKSVFMTTKDKGTPIEASIITVNWCPNCDADEDYMETYHKQIK